MCRIRSRRTKRKFNVNLFRKKFFWVEEQMWIQLTLSAAGLRTINKKALTPLSRKLLRRVI